MNEPVQGADGPVGAEGADREASIFGDEPPSGTFFFLRDLVQARKQAGRKATGVLRDYLAICVRKRRIASPDYYFKFRLYEHGAKDRARIHDYVDDIDRRDLNVTLNRLALSRDTVDHKYHLEKLLGVFGVRTAETLALMLDRRGGLRGVVHGPDELRALFRSAPFPLFGKPVNGSMSRGAVVIEGYEEERDALTLSKEGEVALATFVDQVADAYGEHGYLLQRRLEPHPDMRRMSGDAIGSVRVVTLSDEESTEPLYAVWKVPSVGAIADNFWRAGNLVAHVDVDTGEVLSCRLGSGTEGRAIEEHPETGQRLVGIRLPGWEEVRRATVEAAAAFHTVRVIGWDVAVTAEGPAIIEGNTNPDHSLLQIAAGTGLYASEAGRHLLRARAVEEERIAAREDASKQLDREFRRQRKEQALSEGFKV